MDANTSEVDEVTIDCTDLEAVVETDKGQLRFGFLPEAAPATVANFVKLAKDGFYDGLRFHRVIKDFMVQSGCPRGDGTGGPGYTIAPEFNDTKHVRGTVSMARGRHPNSAGSQFFIVHGEAVPHCDGQYTAFARVQDGLDVLDAIASVPTKLASETGERSVPVEDIVIRSITIEERDVAEGDPVAEVHSSEPEAPEKSIPAQNTEAQNTEAQNTEAGDTHG